MAPNRNLLPAWIFGGGLVSQGGLKIKESKEKEKETRAIEGWIATSHQTLTMRHLLKLISEAGHVAVRSGERLILEVTLKARPKAKSVNVHYKAEVAGP